VSRRRAFPAAVALAAAAALAGGCPGPESPDGGGASGAAGGGSAGGERLAKRLADARALLENTTNQTIDEQTRILELIVRDYPESEIHDVALSRLALNYYVKGRLDETEAACHTFLALHVDSPHFVFPLQFGIDRATKAVADAATPEAKAAAQAKLDQSLAEASDYIERRLAKKSVRDDPLAWMYRMRLASLSGDAEAAIRYATDLVDAYPDSKAPEFMQYGLPEALETGADALAARDGEGDRAKAIADYEKLLAYLESLRSQDPAVQKAIERVRDKLERLKRK